MMLQKIRKELRSMILVLEFHKADFYFCDLPGIKCVLVESTAQLKSSPNRPKFQLGRPWNQLQVNSCYKSRCTCSSPITTPQSPRIKGSHFLHIKYQFSIGHSVPVPSAVLLRKNFQSYSMTKKVFPIVLDAAVSAVMMCFYTYVVISGGNPPPKSLKSSDVAYL
ncbi:hypothetical protein POM88_007335 [Heracleum sosnowskyi]|uniref:Uncharacterized protein n=1 Tax=Heracleum sosnowskyi TaxID=360622 RepID=A0AAD8N659_9APIA|nr:hypothetical protein POM88_007335 [Heracleum sosnowskyi]